MCKDLNIAGWKKSKYNVNKIKKLLQKVQNLKHSKSNNPAKKASREVEIINAHRELIDLTTIFYQRAEITLIKIRKNVNVKEEKLDKIEKYITYVTKQIDLIGRRVINGEEIPHKDKIFSIFEPHTEWISKGKTGVPQELGLPVCILEDQHQFILHHQCMPQLTDNKVAVSMVKQTRQKFPNLHICSFDTGFHTSENVANLKTELDKIVFTKRGMFSSKEQEVVKSGEFIQLKNQHSAVESAISALDNQGLDMCPDRGIVGFERYVATGILARNMQILGKIIQKRELRILKRLEKLKCSRMRKHLAA